MALIDAMRAQGKQTILLIPEISLTYQNLRRFYERFGNRVAVVNSRLSAGEKYDSYENARSGRIDIMIGPRSALFTPFPNLGMIIVDEEHESAYNSETSPRYRAVETAITRGHMAGAGVVLGSATPSLESYTKALSGEYALFRITRRARVGSVLPEVKICDLRKELREGNKTIFSRILTEAIQDRLEKREQVMLFLNRRGYAGFISCSELWLCLSLSTLRCVADFSQEWSAGVSLLRSLSSDAGSLPVMRKSVHRGFWSWYAEGRDDGEEVFPVSSYASDGYGQYFEKGQSREDSVFLRKGRGGYSDWYADDYQGA